MSDDNTMKISATVQLTEVTAHKEFLERRVLMLSQVAHDALEQVKKLTAERDDAFDMLRDANIAIEHLTVDRDTAKQESDRAREELYLARHPVADAEEEKE